MIKKEILSVATSTMANKLLYILISILLFCSTTFAQKKAKEETPVKLSTSDFAAYSERVKQVVSLFEFALNQMASDSTEFEEKEAISGDGAMRYFLNNKVKIEDDLDEKRSTPVFKTVKSYMLDVDYFFSNATFTFTIDNIAYNVSPTGQAYFKVITTRKIVGKKFDNDSIHNSITRFFELNLDKQKELKIASIYTTKYNEIEELRAWWKTLSKEWRIVLATDTIDSLDTEKLKKVAYLERLDISNLKDISTFEPLSRLTGLKELNLSNTGIKDLDPIRSLTLLELLDISSNPIKKLDALEYLTGITNLNIAKTGVSSLEILGRLYKIETLNCSKTPLSSLEEIARVYTIKHLFIQGTRVSTLKAIRDYKKLETLDISGTRVDSLGPISAITNLRELYITGCPILTIEPIQNLDNLRIINADATFISKLPQKNNNKALERIYCDRTSLKKADVIQYRYERPSVLVIYESAQLFAWWRELDSTWKKIIRKYTTINDSAKKEQLATIPALTNIDISDNKNINALAPLQMLTNLQELYLNNTDVNGLTGINKLHYLKILEFSNTSISKLEPLKGLHNLNRINCNSTQVDSLQIKAFIETHPECLVVYRSGALSTWWNGLSDTWKKIFSRHIALDKTPTEIQLHKLVLLDSISIQNIPINDLTPLIQFRRLKKLYLYNTQIKSLEPLRQLSGIQYLQCSKSPITSLKPLQSIWELHYLDISNTPIETLDDISMAGCMQELNISGTRIDDLEPLQTYYADLEVIDCSNTDVDNLKYIERCAKLSKVICYNTKIKEKHIKRLQQKLPKCEVQHF